MSISIQTAAFNAQLETELLLQSACNVGAIVSFQGLVRAFDQTCALDYMFLEHFPKVTEKAIANIVDIARERWEISAYRVIHRVGKLYPNEPIVLVVVLSTHRKSAFAAAEFIMDYLKTQAPFWKCEYFKDGSHHWVEAKETDKTALDKWQK